MALQSSKAFQVMRRHSAGGGRPQLVLRHAPSGRTVTLDGGVLEAQFENERGYLLLTTEGNPQEEALFIDWLNLDLRIGDALEISAGYTPAIFKGAEATWPGQVVFSFFDDGKQWKVTVLEKPRWTWPNYPVKRKAPLWSKSWLLVQQVVDDGNH